MRDVALEEAGVQPTPQGWGRDQEQRLCPSRLEPGSPPTAGQEQRAARDRGRGLRALALRAQAGWSQAAPSTAGQEQRAARDRGRGLRALALLFLGHLAQPRPPAASRSPVGADADVVHVELDGLGLLLVLEVVIGQEVVELVDHWRGGVGPFREAGHLAGERASVRG